ncbi:MAG: HTTM domain-containing protein [Gammaproteobacteria bacterium]|nr:HTTM domain-containing protein [Gammaproteobacteria bacterium]NND58889.1 HTTM domain-containing protein [Gammaproteobacteria bacterium]
MLDKIRNYLFTPVDIASLVFFRVCMGVIMLVEVYRYFDHNWIKRFYMDPDFYFTYYGFGWVQPWPGDGMFWHFAALGVLAFMILVGAFYRIAAILFFIGFSYVFLLDQARYLNHFYLVMLISFLMCFVPANRALSVDAWLRPSIRADMIPRWGIALIVAQFEIVLIYAGLVKINPDWLALQPLTLWLAGDTALPLIGWLFAEKWALALGSYGVIVLHVIGAPLLLWRKTRPYVFVLYLCFHLMNHTVFEIGIFPWMTIVGTLMFFPSDWPRRLWQRFALALEGTIENMRGLRRGAIAAMTPDTVPQPVVARMPGKGLQTVMVVGFVLWCAGQVLIPLRHYAYPSQVAWSEEGHRFAWRMKLRSKRGSARFVITETRSGQKWGVDLKEYLTRKQRRTMACRPDMILQFAHHLRDKMNAADVPDVKVTADIFCSLNGRTPKRLIDPDVDLAAEERTLASVDWILPLDEPLPQWPGPRRLARSN